MSPNKAPRPCRRNGCPNLTNDPGGYCDHHRLQQQRLQDAERGTSTQRGYNYRWQLASKAYLSRHPLCVLCLKKKPSVIRAAVLVDHIIPHRGDMALFWDPNNWQAACDECHNAKTATEDGAFGNKREG